MRLVESTSIPLIPHSIGGFPHSHFIGGIPLPLPPSWTKLDDQVRPSWIKLDQVRPSWIKLGQVGPSWTKLDQVGIALPFHSHSISGIPLPFHYHSTLIPLPLDHVHQEFGDSHQHFGNSAQHFGDSTQHFRDCLQNFGECLQNFGVSPHFPANSAEIPERPGTWHLPGTCATPACLLPGTCLALEVPDSFWNVSLRRPTGLFFCVQVKWVRLTHPQSLRHFTAFR